ncbi:MAG: nucleoside triphosphate pyrophosphohydrolase [Gammaproteobacteria bacterium]|nr:nucleoside triphosphate pyrophosphohydrolase [Gammaproteobacteria bacterium]MCP4275428.1 nucleoside triphosphate pyrophosphohydrolase [Gammaproteobacteria bacterium]MCP4832595.1 nucleoside triphosphate pyrophosphohydrolase [Gammaproteobacteria bacterium]MCP4928114.1 nucleoside triphosphate pyrophosphohydrolase [Gammaproteobacteria bacterium]
MNNITKLLDVMAALRDKETGCPWDIEQNFSSIAPYTIEEAYEVADAIERGDLEDLRGELGDLLLQVVFHSQMASEQGLFAFDDVAGAINEKLIRRHPHVFAGQQAGSAEDQHRAWEQHKAEERAEKGISAGGILSGLTGNLPALTLATKTSKKAASVGFDWENPGQVLEKVHEELDELIEADEQGDQAHIEEELGDLLLAVTNLARHLKVNPEQALRNANRKFTERFNKLEASLNANDEKWTDLSLEGLEARWQSIK